MEKIQETLAKEAFLGSWVAQPVNIFLLLRFKILKPVDFTVLNYILSTLTHRNKFSGQFSVRHLAKNLNISNNTAMKSLKLLAFQKIVLRHFEAHGYGETYTLNLKGLKLILEPLKQRAEEEDRARGGVSKNDTWHSGECIKNSDSTVSNSDTDCIKNSDGTVSNSDTNIRVYNNIYSLYRNSIPPEVQSRLKADIQRLIGVGFAEAHIMAFLELHSKNGVFDFSKIDSFFAVVKSFGKENLNSILSEMTAQRLGREKKQRDLKEALERAASGQVNQKPKLKFRGLN